MKKGKAAKKAAIAVVTAVAVGGVSVGGYYGIRQAQKTTVKVYPVSDFTSGYWGDSMNMEGQITSTASQNIYLSDSQTISQVLVKEGDTVEEKQPIAVIEAMKMENEICAPHDGTVGTVCVQKGASVQTGAALCTM